MKNYSRNKMKSLQIIAASLLFMLFMMQPANKIISQVSLINPDSSLKEKENTIIKKSVEVKQDVALDALKEAAKKVDAVVDQKVKIVYKTKIKTVRDTIWYPLPIDSTFNDYANDQPDTVIIYKTDTVYLQKTESKKGFLKRLFN